MLKVIMTRIEPPHFQSLFRTPLISTKSCCYTVKPFSSDADRIKFGGCRSAIFTALNLAPSRLYDPRKSSPKLDYLGT